MNDLKQIESPKRGQYNFKDINFNDPRVWNMIGRGITKGLFQIESRLCTEWCKRLKPKNIQELSDLIALVRPGCLECLGGNTKVMTYAHTKSDTGQKMNHFVKIEDLYSDFIKRIQNPHPCHKPLRICSFDPKTESIVHNNIVTIEKTGTKDVYEVLISTNSRNKKQGKLYQIESSLDHKFLLSTGEFRELKDLKDGDYIVVLNQRFGKVSKNRKHPKGMKSFRDICYSTHQYKCIFCDWMEASLDVNHIEGNRETNNDSDNLCHMCPNHHRMYTDGKLSKKQLIDANIKHKLLFNKYLMCARYEGKKFISKKETYDICMQDPLNNYIAGGFVVHNSGFADLYAKRRSHQIDTTYIHPKLEAVFKDTYGCMVYQEQLMKVAQEIAGFSSVEADELRRCIAKKKPELIAPMRDKFVSQSQSISGLSQKEAEEVFSWAEKSVRYLFNLSHSVCYAVTAYQSAYMKCHFPTEFYCSWLTFSEDKPDPQEEIYELVSDAKLNKIEVIPPSLEECNKDFKIQKDRVTMFGIGHIKGIGEKAASNIEKNKNNLKTWRSFLVHVNLIKRNIAESLIKSGACDHFGLSRVQMIKELYCLYGSSNAQIGLLKPLSDKELKFTLENLSQHSLLECLQQIIAKKICLKNRIDTIQKKIEYLETQLNSSNKQNAIFEKIYLGLNLSCSAVDDISNKRKEDISECRDIFHGQSNKEYTVYAVIDSIKRSKTGPKSKNPGSEYANLNISDNTGVLKSVFLWPQSYEKYKNMIHEGCVLRFNINKDVWKDREQLAIRSIKEVE